MFITKKHISRRTILKGAGVNLALPFLSAMVPASTALAQTAANPKIRAGFFYIPHGAIMFNTKFGAEMDRWTPSGSGAEFKLNEPQFGVLAALRRATPDFTLSPTELYQSLMITSGAMTNRLDRLTSAGLVTRIPDETDGRSMLVALTAKGRAVVDRAVEAHLENESRLLEWMTKSEYAVLVRTLRRLLACFESANEQS